MWIVKIEVEFSLHQDLRHMFDDTLHVLVRYEWID